MDPKIRESIGLLRHEIISPVIVESGRAQMSYFRSLEEREFDVPGIGKKKFKAPTMKNWLHRFKKHGFTGIVPRERRDSGTFRKLDDTTKEKIRLIRQEWPEIPVIQFYDRCLKAKALGDSPIGLETFRKFMKKAGLFPKVAPAKARKRYEMSRFGELWVGDFMHGLEVKPDAASLRKKKAILMAIIDDHSRMIVGGEWGFQENTLLLEHVFKDAILLHGIPSRLYVDNGASFSSKYLSLVCAHLGIGLVHSKPYDSPSRGKIERFFRTVRMQFLTRFHPNSEILLSELNEQFSTYLRVEYHQRHHGGIDGRPIDRYQASISLYPPKRTDEEALDEYFMMSVERTVNRDSTVSHQGIVYEVSPLYIGRRVTLKFVQGKPEIIYLYDGKDRVGRILPVDSVENGRTYKPSDRDPHIPFQNLIKTQNNNEVSHD
jgi:transposase InsO family protein